jgi:cobalt-zinc-cadmium efflux system outer membrane protein
MKNINIINMLTLAAVMTVASGTSAYAGESYGSLAPQAIVEEGAYPTTRHIENATSILTLDAAKEKAIAASWRIKSVEAEVLAAKGDEAQAGYWLNPEIQFEAENIAGSGSFRNDNSAEYTYGVNHTIEIGGKRSARKNAANALTKAAQANLLIETLNVERDVHAAYAGVLVDAEAYKLAVDQEKLAKIVLAKVSDRVDAAAAPEIQRKKAEVAYETAVIARGHGGRQLELSEAKLANMWGESLLNSVLDHAHFFELDAPESIDHYREKLKSLPDLQQLSYKMMGKKSLVKLEKAQLIPDPSFSLGVRDFKENGEQAFLFGVSIPIPVFNQNRGNVLKAQANVSKAESDASTAKLYLDFQLFKSWQGWNSTYLEAKKLESSLLPSAKAAFALAQEGYEKGKFAYLEVLDAQRTLFNARAQYHKSLKNYHISRANVERLTTTVGDK